MGARDPLLRLLLAWLVATSVACLVVRQVFAISVHPPTRVIASVWRGGEKMARAVLAHAGDHDPTLDAALATNPATGTLVYEAPVGEGPVLVHPEAAFAMSFVPGTDGVAATIGDRTEYLTPDDLRSRQAYDKGIELTSLGFKAGVDVQLVLALFADAFAITVPDLMERAHFERFRVVRSVSGEHPKVPVQPDTLTDAAVRDAALAAARFLARGVDGQGRFRYMVDATTNRTLAGYDWPRHAGATYFLAQAAGLSSDRLIGDAALRAAGWLRDHALVDCGPNRCVGDQGIVDVGSSALGLIAFVEVARAKLDVGYADLVPGLAAFLRAQQRPDGEFMHQYDREAGHPIDIQLLYYSGEAALALSRAASLSGDPGDRDAASRALAHLVGPGWSFFGSRYYFGEEHWTCQAMEDLWDVAPDRRALDFCVRWQAYNRRLQYGPGDSPYDADGAYGFGPLVTPRLTPVGSRCESGIATLDALGRASSGSAADAAELARLRDQMRRSLALLLRHQVGAGSIPLYLLAVPDAVVGAMPASEVDWQLRIDFAQHTGSALIRWLSRPRG
jgi:hypothetical protein